jgi:hypothetical protein
MQLEITPEQKDIALNWVVNQVNKDASIFLNPKVGKVEFKRLFSIKKHGKWVSLTNIDISYIDAESFVCRYLSDSALKKLRNYLRVSASRMGKRTLQVQLDAEHEIMLGNLRDLTGMKDTEIVRKLIEIAKVEKITKTEEQLEITL